MNIFPAPVEFRNEILAEPEDFEVWHDNWETVDLFIRLSSQWRIGPMGGFIGLDYQSVEAAMRMLKVNNTDVIFDNIQVMEYAALAAFNEKK